MPRVEAPRAEPAVPLAGVSPSAVRWHGEVPLAMPGTDLAAASEALQHPVARSVRVLQQAHEPRERYDAMLNVAETLAITASVTAAAILKGQLPTAGSSPQGEPAARALAALRTAYTGRGGGATFGTWTSWLASARLVASAQRAAIPGLAEALGTPDGPANLVDELNALRHERNRAAHGDRPQTNHEFSARVDELMPRIESAVRQSAFLSGLPWLLTKSSSFQPRSQTFVVVTRRIMGDRSEFETRNFTWTQPVATDMVYVLGPAGPVLMSPFVASRFCGRCNQIEICYAYKTGKTEGPATFKSFDFGHDIGVDELGDDLRELPV